MTITIDSNTPRKEITIKDELFTVPVPYTAGHVLSENEANALNQTYHENLRNNFAGVVTAAKKAAEESGAAVDPVTKIAIGIARDLVKKALVKQGKSVKDYSAEAIAEMAKSVVEKHPHIRESAQQQYDLKKAAAATVLTDLAA